MIENLPFLSLDEAIRKAHLTKDIKFLLLPWLNFRLYVKYSTGGRKSAHYYGNEHRITYNQCAYEKVPAIELKPKKGFDNLIWMVENQLKGQYTAAKLYRRAENKQFDILCREYYKGQLNENTINDPVLSDDEGMILYYKIVKGFVIIQEEDPGTPPNFKQHVDEALK